MYTCSKTYSDIPFAHRQHSHEGHCGFIHGHNWTFKFTFGCDALDEKGFVVDFGQLKFIREWITETFDHAYVYNQSDADTGKLLLEFPQCFKAYKVENCSSEGLAKHAHEVVSVLLKEHHGSRVRILAVEVSEDTRNSAEFRP